MLIIKCTAVHGRSTFYNNNLQNYIVPNLIIFVHFKEYIDKALRFMLFLIDNFYRSNTLFAAGQIIIMRFGVHAVLRVCRSYTHISHSP